MTIATTTTLRIVSRYPQLARAVARALGERLPLDTRVVTQRAASLTLRHRPEVPPQVIEEIVTTLAPFEPLVERTEGLTTELELLLGSDQELTSESTVRVMASSQNAADAAQRALASLGVTHESAFKYLPATRILHGGGAPRFHLQALAWSLERQGICPTLEQVWGEHDSDIFLELMDPAHEGKAVRDIYPIHVLTDAPALVETLVSELRRDGFTVAVGSLPRDGEAATRFRLGSGPFDFPGAQGHLSRARGLVEACLARVGVDAETHPLTCHDGGDGLAMEVVLPLAHYKKGGLRPYAGTTAARFDVRVRTDTPEAVAPLLARLRELGFLNVRLLDKGDDPLGSCGCPTPFRLAWELPRGESVALTQLRNAVTSFLGEAFPENAPPLELRRSHDADDPIVIDLPLLAHRTNTLAKMLDDSAPMYNLVIHADGDASALADRLRELGFEPRDVRESDRGGAARVVFGGAPDVLVERVATAVQELTGARPARENAWGQQDRDIYVYLPRAAAADRPGRRQQARAGAVTPALDFDRWVGGARARGLFLEVTADSVRVGDVLLPRRPHTDHPLVPSSASFVGYVVDGCTAHTLLHVARSVQLREPCLLEGETSTSKTSSILFLAQLLRQPVARLNLNGQTDTGELVGRFVPREQGEGGSFVWHDGLVPRALREGLWVVLDEANLAEPQVLERLNPVLEREPTLVLTEHHGEVLRTENVSPQFRLFATMNPATYAGRAALSPAYKDRFRGHALLEAPTEADVEAMLRQLVVGEEPQVTVRGHVYPGAMRAPVYPSLSRSRLVRSAIRPLARFHVAIERASRKTDGLGQARRERYVFTRRAVLSVLELLDAAGPSPSTLREALVRYYVARVAAEDRSAVAQLLDAAGLGPTTWSLDEGTNGATHRDTQADLGPLFAQLAESTALDGAVA